MAPKVTFLLLLVLLLPLFGHAQGTATVISQNANLRELPSPTAKVVSVVPQNTRLRVLGNIENTGWYEVAYGKLRGWINGNTIKLTGYPRTYSLPKPKPMDRWIYMNNSSDTFYYYNPSRKVKSSVSVKMWVKGEDSSDRLTSMEQYEFLCGTQKVRLLSSVQYTTSGDVRRSYSPVVPRFEEIVPETVSESWMKIACR